MVHQQSLWVPYAIVTLTYVGRRVAPLILVQTLGCSTIVCSLQQSITIPRLPICFTNMTYLCQLSPSTSYWQISVLCLTVVLSWVLASFLYQRKTWNSMSMSIWHGKRINSFLSMVNIMEDR